MRITGMGNNDQINRKISSEIADFRRLVLENMDRVDVKYELFKFSLR